MSKDDAISIINNSNLLNKKGVFIFFHYNKNERLDLLSKNRDVIQQCNRAKGHYKNEKERLKEQAGNK